MLIGCNFRCQTIIDWLNLRRVEYEEQQATCQLFVLLSYHPHLDAASSQILPELPDR